MSLSFQERLQVQWRICENATDEVVFGPAAAIGIGTTAVFMIAVAEASAYCKPKMPTTQSWFFCARYGVAQIVPSLIWTTQPAELIAKLTKTPLELLYTRSELSCRRSLTVTRLQALRGAIAGSVLLSQVLGLVNVGYAAKVSKHDVGQISLSIFLRFAVCFCSSSMTARSIFCFVTCHRFDDMSRDEKFV